MDHRLLRRASYSLTVLLASVSLASCAKPAVLKEDATQVSASTQSTVAAARAFYAKLALSRRDYQLAVLASDPNCGLRWYTIVVPDDDAGFGLRCLTDDEKAMRQACLDDAPGEPCTAEHRTRLVDDSVTLDLADAERASALTLVDALATYQIALAAILSDAAFDAKPTLTTLRDRINTLRATLAALERESVTPLDYKAQIAATATLTNLLANLRDDYADLAALRVLLQAQGPALAENLEALALRYEYLDRHLLTAFDRVQLAHRLDRFNEGQRKLTEEKRLDQMRALTAEHYALRQRALTPDALVQSLQALTVAQAQLQRAVVDGTLTDEQRRRIASQSMAQLQAAFDAIAVLVK